MYPPSIFFELYPFSKYDVSILAFNAFSILKNGHSYSPLKLDSFNSILYYANPL